MLCLETPKYLHPNELLHIRMVKVSTRGVNRMVRHDSIRYRFSYPAIQYLQIPQKIIRYDYDSIQYRSISIDILII